MKLLKKILVALERDESSRQALLAASGWANAFGLELHLVHVVPDPKIIPENLDYAVWVAEQCDEMEIVMTGWEQTALAGRAFVISNQIRHGTVHQELLAAAEEVGAGAIFCGSGSHSRGPRPRVGGVAERLARHARQPVLVQHPDRPTVPKTILCPVDLTPTSARALRNALYIATVFDAELIALFVNQHAPVLVLVPGHIVHEIQKEWDKEREHDFIRFLSRFELRGVRFSHEVRVGEPEEQILAAIADYRVDLAVMGSIGRTRIARFLFGSVGQKVTRKTPCSIMTVKEEDVVEAEQVKAARAGAVLELAPGLSNDLVMALARERMFSAEAGRLLEKEVVRKAIVSREAAADSLKLYGRVPGKRRSI